MQHHRGDDAAAPAPPAQRRDPLVAVAARAAEAPLGPPAVSTQALGPTPPAQRSCRNSVISGNSYTGYVSSSGNSSSSSARAPTFTRTRRQPRSRSQTESAAKLPASASQARRAAAR